MALNLCVPTRPRIETMNPLLPLLPSNVTLLPATLPFAVRRLVRRFSMPIETAVITAEAAGLGERGR